MTPNYQQIFDLSGRVALVTGSSRGIGAAIAKGLADFGASVALHGSAESPPALKLRDAIRSEGRASDMFVNDLSAPKAGSRLIKDVFRQFGRLDILVINASAQINEPIDAVTEATLSKQLRVNFQATVEMLQSALPIMTKAQWGRVVNIGSVNQRSPKAIVSVYAATKAAQHNLIASQAREYAKHGVLLNTLAPGMVDTDRNADRKTADPKAWKEYVSGLNWMGRAASVDEMVGAAVFLSSPACSFMAGESIYLTGGC